MPRKKHLLTALFVATVIAGAVAKGGGGFLLQRQMPSWDIPPLPSADPYFQAWTLSGYGYGISASGFMVGGFSQVSLEMESNNYYSSAVLSGSKVYFDFFGGLLLGQSVGDEGLRLNAACKLGLGLLERFADSGITGNDEVGGLYTCGLLNPYLELSLPTVPWMRLSAILGYQYIYAFGGLGVADGSSGVSSSYTAGTPTLGVALTFGQ
jgi:hypothetical protein